jgi:hypothetical protein
MSESPLFSDENTALPLIPRGLRSAKRPQNPVRVRKIRCVHEFHREKAETAVGLGRRFRASVQRHAQGGPAVLAVNPPNGRIVAMQRANAPGWVREREPGPLRLER